MIKLIQHTEKIWALKNFLTAQECEELILFSEQQGYQEAEVGFSEGAKMAKNIRNNYRLIYIDNLLAEKYWQRLHSFCPENLDDMTVLGLNEQFRFYKYESGQRFKKHIDGRFKRNENEESRITFMIYLNEDFEGGETTFEDLIIKPVTGTALCFIHEQKHEGSPVLNGTKYALRSDVMYKKL
ncbi:MAG: 2OG-Fe(II) oxygenase [Raineya sp.]|jgi:predicted 2-oxoglutarate/Fe(II)-dependent dioxygenase YbiX|nr:2OG-Fe(II) oxygenase [Raineya sp.]